MSTLLFERTGLSTNKESVISKVKDKVPVTPTDVIKNPYLLEFMGLEEKSEYSETELEQAIITHLQQFLIELGRGFCFEARQKRITFDNKHYRVVPLLASSPTTTASRIPSLDGRPEVLLARTLGLYGMFDLVSRSAAKCR